MVQHDLMYQHHPSIYRPRRALMRAEITTTSTSAHANHVAAAPAQITTLSTVD
jgi:hypothetical protein